MTDFTSRPASAGTTAPSLAVESLFPREVELEFSAGIDPYASAVVRISAGEEPTRGASSSPELSVRLDEATRRC